MTARPHAVTAVTKTGAATGSETFTYDAAGNTTTRTPNGANATTYGWDQAGRISTTTTPDGNTSYLYDADGNRLIAKNPTGTTLYIDGISELRYTTATQTTTATRTYSWLGQTLAVRSDGTGVLDFTVTDPHNTGELSIKSSDGTFTTRRTNPFGQPRGTTPTAWAGDRGFVGGIQDTTTGLTQLGARPYDPTLGRFLSVDPVLDLTDPQQWNPYNYSANNPTTWSDPTGLEHDAEGGVGGAGCTRHCPAAPGADFNSGYPTKPQKKKSNGLTGGLKKAAKGIGGFSGGIAKGAKALLWDDNPNIQNAFNLYDFVRNPSGYIERQHAVAEAFWQDPLGNVWNAVTADVRDDWNKGEKASAVGRVTFDVVTLFLGGEAAVTKLGKLGKVSKVGKAAESVARNLDDLGSLRGATPDEIRGLIPEGWIEKPLKKGDGVRFLNPKRPGESISIEGGWPGHADPLHSGPYVKISRDGAIERIPLQGNPTLGN